MNDKYMRCAHCAFPCVAHNLFDKTTTPKRAGGCDMHTTKFVVHVDEHDPCDDAIVWVVTGILVRSCLVVGWVLCCDVVVVVSGDDMEVTFMVIDPCHCSLSISTTKAAVLQAG